MCEAILYTFFDDLSEMFMKNRRSGTVPVDELENEPVLVTQQGAMKPESAVVTNH